nr:hypothetical protein [uncultured Gellertiella sp.]
MEKDSNSLKELILSVVEAETTELNLQIEIVNSEMEGGGYVDILGGKVMSRITFLEDSYITMHALSMSGNDEYFHDLFPPFNREILLDEIRVFLHKNVFQDNI